MSIRVGINGFGRMGRLALRLAWTRSGLDIVHVNDPNMPPDIAAHLLEYDSLHRRWDHEPVANVDSIFVGDRSFCYSQNKLPGEVQWAKSGVDLVLECSGQFRSTETLNAYFDCNVKKVVVSAPVHHGALNVVMGVNQHLYEPNRDRIVTAASCTTNCLAPVVKVLHESLRIRHGVITTIHDVTNTQRIVDQSHTDARRARSSLLSLIPTSTGSAKAIGLIYPELQGKVSGIAVRAPVLNSSLTDCVFEVEKATDADAVNYLLEAGTRRPELDGILGFSKKPLVSIDFQGDSRSSIVDGPSTMVVDGTLVKVLAWYDGEYGYVSRLIELAEWIGKDLV